MANAKLKPSRVYPSETEPCRSLPEFLSAIAELRPRWRKLNLPTQSDKIRPSGDEKLLWFRGQSNAKWGLLPKIWRPEYEGANEPEMRLEFESIGHQFTKPGVALDKWQWYFLMQHYGAPTRLLDWTTNPLVALYFAVSDETDIPRPNSTVWVIDPWRWNRAHVKDLFGPAVAGWNETAGYLLDLEDAFDSNSPKENTTKKWPIALEPYHVDQRIAAQSSTFTLFGTKRDMSLSPAINNPKGGEVKHAILDRLQIPGDAAVRILQELNHIGINERTMFPGLESVGKQIAREWKPPVRSKTIKG